MSEPESAITIERSERTAGGRLWWWVLGETYPHRETLKRHGARFSGQRKAWYFIGETLPEAIRALAAPDDPQPELERQVVATRVQDDAHEQTTPPEPAPAAGPQIRVSKPEALPAEGALDAIQTAIRDTQGAPPQAATAPAAHGRLTGIGQAFCGEIAGSITGQVFCYGYAVHDGVAIYVNMAGPRMAAEAIRAKLSKGEQVTLVPPDAPALELTAGEGNTGMYHAYLHYLPQARFASLILVHDLAVTPNYNGKATTFIFRTSEAQATAKLTHHVTQLVNVPVFDAWSAYLYDAGQRAMLVRKARAAGGIDLLSVDLDADAWTRLITGGLSQGVIALPHTQ